MKTLREYINLIETAEQQTASCPDCQGEGKTAYKNAPCPRCHGKGYIPIKEGEDGLGIEDMVMDQYYNGNSVEEIASYLNMSQFEVQNIIDKRGEQDVNEDAAEEVVKIAKEIRK